MSTRTIKSKLDIPNMPEVVITSSTTSDMYPKRTYADLSAYFLAGRAVFLYKLSSLTGSVTHKYFPLVKRIQNTTTSAVVLYFLDVENNIYYTVDSTDTWSYQNIPVVEHKSNHFTGGFDALTPADIGAATKPVVVTVNFTVAGWVQNATTLAYEQSVACAGLLATDDARTRIEPEGNASDAAAQALTDEAYGMVDYFACNTDGYLYARCPDGAPTVAFSVKVVIAR